MEEMCEELDLKIVLFLSGIYFLFYSNFQIEELIFLFFIIIIFRIPAMLAVKNCQKI